MTIEQRIHELEKRCKAIEREVEQGEDDPYTLAKYDALKADLEDAIAELDATDGCEGLEELLRF